MTHVSIRFPESLSHVATLAEELSREVLGLPHGDLSDDPALCAALQVQTDDFRAHLLAMERKAGAISRNLGVGLVNRSEAISRSSEPVTLKSGFYVRETYDLGGGLVSMQVRGPVGQGGGWIGIGDAAPGILPLGRVVATTDLDAERLLRRRLVLLGELD